MTLANLKEELCRKAAGEASAIEERAREAAKLGMEKAEREAAGIVERAKEDAREFAAKERMRISAANIRANRIVQDAQFGLVQEAVDEVRALLKKTAGERREYKKIFERFAAGAVEAAGKDCVLQVNNEDAALAKQFGMVDRKPLDCIGGLAAVSADGRIKIDNTFEALLEEQDGEIRQRAYEMLFK